ANEVYRAYERWLRERNEIDHADQILLAVDLLERDDVSEVVCGSIREVYVDEAQDLSPAQWALVERIATDARLTVVGDPRQAIYAWNGADPAVFDALAARRDTRTIDLVRNYRSQATLLVTANRVMGRYPPLQAVRGDETAESLLVRPATVDAHDDAVVRVVERWLDAGVPDDEIAVLVRTNEQVDRLTRRLRQAGRAVRALGLPPLPATHAFRLAQRLLPAEHDPDDETLAATMDRLRARPDVQDAVLRGARPGPEEDPWSDWHRLTAELAEQERRGVADPAVALEAVAEDAEGQRATGGVVVATVHKAKGLEWSAVVVAEATRRSYRDTEEDRCLAYVALTRARDRRAVVAHPDGDGLTPLLDDGHGAPPGRSHRPRRRARGHADGRTSVGRADLGSLTTGGASGAAAASAPAGSERYRHPDPLVTGRHRRELARALGHPDTTAGIPEARWVRAMTFERLVRHERFVSRLLTTAVGQLGLERPVAVLRADGGASPDTTAEKLAVAHERAVADGAATMVTGLAVPFVGLEHHPDATPVKPDFAIVARRRARTGGGPQAGDPGPVVGSWLIVGDAKDYE